MTTGPGDGDAGTGPGPGGPPRLVQICDAIGDAIWSFRITFALLRQRWSR